MEGLPLMPQDIDWLSLPEVATRMGIGVSRLHQLRRERELIAVQREEGLRIPADFLDGAAVVKHLPSVLTLLADGGFSDSEAIDWLFSADPSLPGTPIQALRENRGTEVKRRAQASAL